MREKGEPGAKNKEDTDDVPPPNRTRRHGVELTRHENVSVACRGLDEVTVLASFRTLACTLSGWTTRTFAGPARNISSVARRLPGSKHNTGMALTLASATAYYKPEHVVAELEPGVGIQEPGGRVGRGRGRGRTPRPRLSQPMYAGAGSVRPRPFSGSPRPCPHPKNVGREPRHT